MTFFKSRLFQVIGVVALIAILLIIAFIIVRNNRMLHDNHKFTIGTPIRYDVNSNTSNDLVYIYFVNNVRYMQDSPCSDYSFSYRSLINRNFYVMFNPDNPKNSKLLLDFPVPDSIREAPPEGWDKIPNIPDWQQPK